VTGDVPLSAAGDPDEDGAEDVGVADAAELDGADEDGADEDGADEDGADEPLVLGSVDDPLGEALPVPLAPDAGAPRDGAAVDPPGAAEDPAPGPPAVDGATGVEL
jgi:hypothetical protein